LQMVFLRHGDAVIERKANNFERESNWTNEREIDGLILVQVDYDKNGWMVRSKVEKKLVHYRPILQWVQAKRIQRSKHKVDGMPHVVAHPTDSTYNLVFPKYNFGLSGNGN
jgi:hypothetical protein